MRREMMGISIDQYYLTEHDPEGIEMKEREIQKRIMEEHEQGALKPYFDLMHGIGVREQSLPEVVRPIIELYRMEGKVFFKVIEGEHLLFYQPINAGKKI